ncbi:hypothetical protein [Roseofilum casamattae]|uniref:Transposase n=1 Tax=Roseofilum casamattae BLCC-M143 TaxID=3022442 RepID=A0ABT7BVQ5_9CYAN|nr:hypothetical protein [Roseofilum casamattae]MDJ1183265.1 hypothetical protein [Roseofilum casamattae BLCC-M143]
MPLTICDRIAGKPHFFVNLVNIDRDRRLHLHETSVVETLCVNIICRLIAYCEQPKKPRLHLEWALPPSA